MSSAIVFFVMAAGVGAGCLGALFGIGGGLFLVPFFVLVLDLPIRTGIAVSLATVMATSSVLAAGGADRELVNMRLGMLLQVSSAIGALTGGLTVQALSERTLIVLFSVVAVGIGFVMVRRMGRRNVILDPAVDPGALGGRFHEEESGGVVSYRVRRLPLGLVVTFLSGNLSSLLGIGGGIINVPVLNAWCGVPLRAAAATSAFMIGVTALAAVPIYYARGDLVPHLAGAAVLGVMAGSRAGFWFGARSRAKWLKLTLAGLLFVVAGLMLARLR